MDRRERFLGCLLGGAVGDALGAGVEFLSLTEIRKQFGYDGVTDLVPAYGGIGRITDDTQMVLFTAEGLLRAFIRSEAKGLCDAPSVVLGAYYRWLKTQGETPPWEVESDGWLIGHEDLHARRAPGTTCLSALRTGRIGTPAEPLNDSKGCGGIMRIAPVGLVALDSFELGIEVAALTHGHPSGNLSAGALALIVRQVVRDWPLIEAIALAHQRLCTEPEAGETLIAIETALDLASEGDPSSEKVESLGAGWVAEEALAISLYCALVARDYREGVLLAVNHSGDSDSTAAITGNILGAVHGVRGIPEAWISKIELGSVVEQLADDLYTVAAGRAPKEDDREFQSWWLKYPGW